MHNAADAKLAVDACKFSPVGQRSGSAVWPHFDYRRLPAIEARNALNDNTTVVLMIESRRGLEQVEAIAAVPGVDVIHVGCGDLAADLGHAGDKRHPDVLAAIGRAAQACRTHGVALGLGGFSTADPALLETLLALKPGLVTAANEWTAMMEALHSRAEAVSPTRRRCAPQFVSIASARFQGAPASFDLARFSDRRSDRIVFV